MVYFLFLTMIINFWALELMFSTPKQDFNNAHEVHCSRERSRVAWKIIEEVLNQPLNGVLFTYIAGHAWYDMVRY